MKRFNLKHLFEFLYYKSWSFGFWTPADRSFLTTQIFSFFENLRDGQKILFVGTHRYTKAYETFFSRQNFMTIDRDPQMAKYGAKTHQTVDVTHLQETGFDVIVLNGVIGFGLDKFDDIRAAALKLRNSLKPGGWLVLGTHPSVFSPDVAAVFSHLFLQTTFPPTGETFHQFKFPLSSQIHEYRFFKSKDQYAGVAHANKNA